MTRLALCLLGLLSSAHADMPFTGTFDVERTWIGPNFWANRLQDWQAADGRLECVAGSARLPLRTVHLLTRDVDPAGLQMGDVVLDMSVELGPLGASEGAFAGLLFGAGSHDIDYRLSAMVHHRPAPDGGVMAVVDANGRVMMRDNQHDTGQQGLWSIAGTLDLADLPELEPSSRDEVIGEPLDHIILHVVIEKAALDYRATVESTTAAGEPISAAAFALTEDQVDGHLALVSHGGEPDAGFWFDTWRIDGAGLVAHDRAFGPVLMTQYTLHDRTLKLTAQAAALGEEDSTFATLEALTGTGGWKQIAEAALDPDALTFRFRVDDWDVSQDTPVRIVCQLGDGQGGFEDWPYHLLVQREPDDEDVVIGAMNCHKIYTGGLKWNHDGLWFPHDDLVSRVFVHQPDLVCFLGDQIYEGDLTPLDTSPIDQAILDYHYKWWRFCWAFKDVTRDRPTVMIPDDHDVFHGNLWGAGGKATASEGGGAARQDSGGYKMPARFVNMVHRTQTSHLPDPGQAVDTTPIGMGISVYSTRLVYAGLDLAILADRQWKSAPKALLPEAEVVNGWAQNPEWDPHDADHPDAQLLGPMQERLLDLWSQHWRDDDHIKIVLSQTPWANVATLPAGATSGGVIPRLPILPEGEYPENHRPAADMDSGGWPQSARDRAIRAMRAGSMLHITGDQHLASTIRYGVDDFNDAGYVFTVPAIANTWPRRWQPEQRGANQAPGAPRYTGEYVDGFGNRMTVLAVANPVISGKAPANLHDRMPGYGIIRVHKPSRRITLECWPRWADPTRPEQQYPGWPIKFVDDRR